MDPSKKRGWNREILSQRQNTISDSSEGKELTDAEYHLTVGRIVSHRVSRGLDIEGYADQVNMTVEECRLASAYANSSPGMIFRALVEDWPWQRIQAELIQSQHGGE